MNTLHCDYVYSGFEQAIFFFWQSILLDTDEWCRWTERPRVAPRALSGVWFESSSADGLGAGLRALWASARCFSKHNYQDSLRRPRMAAVFEKRHSDADWPKSYQPVQPCAWVCAHARSWEHITPVFALIYVLPRAFKTPTKNVQWKTNAYFPGQLCRLLSYPYKYFIFNMILSPIGSALKCSSKWILP